MKKRSNSKSLSSLSVNSNALVDYVVEHSFTKFFAKRVLELFRNNDEETLQTRDILSITDHIHFCVKCYKRLCNERRFGCWDNSAMCSNQTCIECKVFCHLCKKHFCSAHSFGHKCLTLERQPSSSERLPSKIGFWRYLAISFLLQQTLLKKRTSHIMQFKCCNNITYFHDEKCSHCYRRNLTQYDNNNRIIRFVGFKGQILGGLCNMKDCLSFNVSIKHRLRKKVKK